MTEHALTHPTFSFGMPPVAWTPDRFGLFSVVDPATRRRYTMVSVEELEQIYEIEDKLLVVTAELVHAQAQPEDFEDWESVKRRLEL